MDSNYTFPKEQKICSKITIDNLFKNGEKLFKYPLTILFLENKLALNRVMITVPKKRHKTAVARNALKRKIRESYRLNEITKNYSKNYDIAFVYSTHKKESTETINKSINTLLAKLNED